MSYFSADERLEAGTAAVRPAAPAAPDKARTAAPSSFFAIDEKLEAGAEPAAPAAPTAPAPGLQCPACNLPLQSADGWLACPACAARYLAVRGTLVAANALPHGACACCRPRQALVFEQRRPVCPLSGRPHVLRADGGAQLADEAQERPPAVEAPLPGLAEIDAALAANSALLTIHGVFIRS